MKKLSDNGFSAIEAILVLVILAMVGFVGYYVYHANRTANKTYNQASNEAQSNPKSTKSTPAVKKGDANTAPADSAAAKQAQATYDAYLKVSADRSMNFDARLTAIKPFLSSDLYDKLKAAGTSGGADPIFCAQANPTKISAVDDGTDGTSAKVNESFGSTTHTVTVTYDQSSKLITAITCPAAS